MNHTFATITLAATLCLASCTSGRDNEPFTLYQLPSVADDHGDSYIIETAGGHIIAVDGGKAPETDYMRGFIAAKGNHVDAWIITHPHSDHMAVLSNILRQPMGMTIDRIYHSRFTPEQYNFDPASRVAAFYRILDSVESAGNSKIIDCKPGDTFDIDGAHFKILSRRNPEITSNLINNSSMAFRVEDSHKSIVNLGDLGIEGGNKLLQSEYRSDLDCDYLKMPHHGQSCCDSAFFATINFRACLWPTPTWLWTNTHPETAPGEGPWTTLETRRWMDEKGITEHYVMADGLAVIR